MQEIAIQEVLINRHPSPVILVGSADRNGTPNVMPAGWFTFANREPLWVAISIAPSRYSHKLILETKEFTVCFPSVGQEKDLIYCGEVSGKDLNKFEHCSLKPLAAKKVKAPLIKDSVLCLECRLVKQVDCPDHTIFFGEVVAAQADQAKQRIFDFGKTADDLRIIKGI